MRSLTVQLLDRIRSHLPPFFLAFVAAQFQLINAIMTTNTARPLDAIEFLTSAHQEMKQLFDEYAQLVEQARSISHRSAFRWRRAKKNCWRAACSETRTTCSRVKPLDRDLTMRAACGRNKELGF